MAGLADLSTILARFLTAGKQIILKSDFVSLISSILAPLPRAALPPLVWVDATRPLRAANSGSAALIERLMRPFSSISFIIR